MTIVEAVVDGAFDITKDVLGGFEMENRGVGKQSRTPFSAIQPSERTTIPLFRVFSDLCGIIQNGVGSLDLIKAGRAMSKSVRLRRSAAPFEEEEYAAVVSCWMPESLRKVVKVLFADSPVTTHLVLRGEITLQEEGKGKSTYRRGDRADVGANIKHEAWIGPEVLLLQMFF